MEKISRYVSMEDDPWFIKGEQKGELRKQRQFVVSLIQATDFDDAKIASLTSVDIEFVRQVRVELEHEGK